MKIKLVISCPSELSFLLTEALTYAMYIYDRGLNEGESVKQNNQMTKVIAVISINITRGGVEDVINVEVNP